MVYVRLAQEWVDGQGNQHPADTMVDVDAGTLAELEAVGVVAEAGLGFSAGGPGGNPDGGGWVGPDGGGGEGETEGGGWVGPDSGGGEGETEGGGWVGPDGGSKG